MEELIEKCKEAVKGLRECGVTDELVLVVPYMLYMSYIDHVWERMKESMRGFCEEGGDGE